MAYEFKRLSDVEVVAEPAESANVLIEEDGVIKKAPKTAVGGGIGNFIIISVPCEEPSELTSDIIPGATCNKTYDEVIEMYCAGEIDGAFIKVIASGICTLVFSMVDHIALLNQNGPVNVSNVASAQCVQFVITNAETIIYYSRNGLSYHSPFDS